VRTGIVVLEVIEKINRELGTTTVLITHNSVISQMAHRVISISDGKVAQVQQNDKRISAQELWW
jgi:putative ABC transport system ATP-binding protein